jgi:hypothetical protein
MAGSGLQEDKSQRGSRRGGALFSTQTGRGELGDEAHFSSVTFLAEATRITAEEIQRQIAVFLIIALKEGSFLSPMQRVVGRFLVDDNQFRRLLARLQKDVDEKIIHLLLTRNVTKKLSQTSEPSSGLSDDRFKLRPQRQVNLETLIEVTLRFRLAPLLQIADAAIEEGQGAARI